MGKALVDTKNYYDDACRSLQQADRVDEFVEIKDDAGGMEAYARRAKNKELEILSRKIRFKSIRRIGQLIELQKATVGLAKGAREKGTTRGKQSPASAPPTLDQAGIDKDLAKLGRKFAKLTDTEFDKRLLDDGLRILSSHAELVEQKMKKSGSGRPRPKSSGVAPKTELNSLAWSDASVAQRTKFLDAIGVKSVWEAMTPLMRDAVRELAIIEPVQPAQATLGTAHRDPTVPDDLSIPEFLRRN